MVENTESTDNEKENDSALAPVPEALSLGGARYTRSRIAFVIVGLIALAAVVVAVLNFGEISAFAVQAANAEPAWLLLAIASQCCAFVTIAYAWRIVLVSLDERLSLLELFPLSIAKLFADQALPSGGISGAVFLLHALRRRRVAWDHAFTAFAFAALGAILAFLIAAIVSFMAIAGADNAPSILTTAARAFYILLIAVVIVGAVVLMSRSSSLLDRLPFAESLARGLKFVRAALSRITENKPLFARVTAVQLLQRVFDAITLWLAFFAIGGSVPFAACFIAVSIASVAATIAPTPMGIGTFEGGMVASLAIFGIPVEAALTATLLYRGLSLWLPLIPGFYVIQRELLRAPRANAPTPGAPMPGL